MAVPNMPEEYGGQRKIFQFLKISDWRSDYKSVDNALRYLKRKSKSEASKFYLAEVLKPFCMYQNVTNPDELVSRGVRKVEKMIHDYLDAEESREISRRRIKGERSLLLLFFRENGFRRERELDIDQYSVPSRYRKTPEYVPTIEEAVKMTKSSSLKRSSLIWCIITAGLRNATLRAIRYRDIKSDFEKGVDTIFVPVYPEMKTLIPNACKNNVPYYTFFARPCVEVLRSHMREREQKYGLIKDDDVIFCSEDRRLNSEQRRVTPLSRSGVQRLVKEAAYNAGIEEWKDVFPHCLRKVFATALANARLSDNERLFLFGHILPGAQDVYFGSGAKIIGSTVTFDRNKVQEMREKYRSLRFLEVSEGAVRDEAVLEAMRRFAEPFGIDPRRIRIEKQRELGRELNGEEEMELIQEEIKKIREQEHQQSTRTDPNGKKKIVAEDELADRLAQGWEIQTILPSGKILISLID